MKSKVSWPTLIRLPLERYSVNESRYVVKETVTRICLLLNYLWFCMKWSHFQQLAKQTYPLKHRIKEMWYMSAINKDNFSQLPALQKRNIKTLISIKSLKFFKSKKNLHNI